MIVGGWTRRLAPLPGELLSSCLARNAYAHGSTPYRFLNLFWQGAAVWDRDFDRDPAGLAGGSRALRPSEWLDRLGRQLGLPSEAVAESTLASWQKPFGEGLRPAAGDVPLILSAGVFHRTRRRHALQFCPDCLGEGVPHFRKAWRLGFAVACEAHGGPLMDACGWCSAGVVPHRSITARLIDCHECGRSITGGSRPKAGQVPEVAFDLQHCLTALLEAGKGKTCGPLGMEEAFGTVRALLAVSAPSALHQLLRNAFGLLPDAGEGAERRRFEQARHAVRVGWLETVATWLGDWPHRFLLGAEAIGASQRTFVRCRPPPSLAEQVERLPQRKYEPRRPWQPLLDEPVLRRLRRTDKVAYHAEHAARVLHAIGRA